MQKSLILSHSEISLKLDRIAWQILEQHYSEQLIVLVGLVDRGTAVAQKIKSRLEQNGNAKVELVTLSLDKTNPFEADITLENSAIISRNAIILVDDVLNSGITLAAALKEVLNHNPKSVRTAVLANRDHHKFPIQANYVGISLATTVKEHITYEEKDDEMSIWLS
jgi:pyrimidine operon attenuation protein/uracil phosphoribosyltransferase